MIATLEANGINPDTIQSDPMDIAEILEATKRTIHRGKWVEEYAMANAAASFNALG